MWQRCWGRRVERSQLAIKLQLSTFVPLAIYASLWLMDAVVNRQDCFNLLSQCIDWSRMPADTSAAAICSRLSLENPTTPCVSLEPFLEPSDQPYSPPRDHVTQPCKGEPCAAGQVCQVNRYCPPFIPRNCLPYTCSTGQ